MATYEIDGNKLLDEIETIDLEKKGALKALTYLLDENICTASTCKQDGAYVMAFRLKFQRSNGPTTIKAKVAYSKTMGEEVDIFCNDTKQGDLFGEEE